MGREVPFAVSLKLDLSLCDLKANPRDVLSVRDISSV
jgi:hypothetical protein